MEELTVDATIENVTVVTDFINEKLEALEVGMKTMAQIDVAIDELFSNIANYAYHPEVGKATVNFDLINNHETIVITFIDKGKPYNPLEREDPDITLAAEDRGVGGLGVFMVKKTMDDVSYEYKDGCNMLTIKKYIN